MKNIQSGTRKIIIIINRGKLNLGIKENHIILLYHPSHPDKNPNLNLFKQVNGSERIIIITMMVSFFCFLKNRLI